MPLIELQNICKNYGNGKNTVHALRDINLSVEKGEFAAIIGKSGCGKSTLLNILGGISLPTTGKYIFDGKEISSVSRKDMAAFRNNNIGFVVQHFALINDITVDKNISLPMEYRGYSKTEIETRVKELLEQLDISDKRWKYPYELSGGQCQRAAIARAISLKPPVILADEPTGALDEETGQTIFDIIKNLNENENITTVIVTHDMDLAAKCSRIIKMKDGRILENNTD